MTMRFQCIPAVYVQSVYVFCMCVWHIISQQKCKLLIDSKCLDPSFGACREIIHPLKGIL